MKKSDNVILIYTISKSLKKRIYRPTLCSNIHSQNIYTVTGNTTTNHRAHIATSCQTTKLHTTKLLQLLVTNCYFFYMHWLHTLLQYVQYIICVHTLLLGERCVSAGPGRGMSTTGSPQVYEVQLHRRGSRQYLSGQSPISSIGSLICALNFLEIKYYFFGSFSDFLRMIAVALEKIWHFDIFITYLKEEMKRLHK